MALRQKRSKAMKVLMTESTNARLFELAEMLGQPAATLASVAISEYVARYMGAKSAQDKAIAATLEYLGPEFKEQMKLQAVSP